MAAYSLFRYLEALHHRIRELEQACRQADVAMPASQVEDSSTSVRESAALPITDGIPSPLNPSHENPAGAEDDVNTSRTLQGADTHTGLGGIPSSRPRGEYAASYSALAFNSPHTDLYPSPTPFDPRSTVTGMGAVDAVRERERPPNQVNDYFGSSSTASLIRHLTQNPARGFDHPAAPNTPTQPPAGSATPTRGGELPSLIQEDWTRSRLRVDNFFLPPRDLADHLLERFWDRIYCIYPFFDRGSFQNAYENLWVPRNEPGKNLSEQDIGLGNRLNSGNTSIVFICALNIVFALGCHFADIPVAEREPLAHTFFLRSKQHIGLDMLDLRNVGVVQTLLIVALYLQSTPYPHRCWNSIGVACRLAQGLGMHEAQMYALKGPLEQEIHRRTWHGCVMMDKYVSQMPWSI